MKNTIFNILSIFSFLIPIKLLIKLSGIKIIYPFYHIVNDEPPIHVKHLYKVRTVKQFRKDLDFLLKYFISTNDILPKPKDKQNYFYISFDDGLYECYDVIAPILKEYNIKASFFINSGFADNRDLFFKYKASIIIDKFLNNNIPKIAKLQIAEILNINSKVNHKIIKREVLKINCLTKQKLDKIANLLKINFNDYLQENKPYLTSNQIKKLSADGHKIGAHSIDHPRYSEIRKEEQIRQTFLSMKYIEDEFGIKNKLFAFPFTDDQVTNSFFEKIFKENMINYTFGTAGIKEDSITKNIQRIPIEKKAISAKTYIKTEYLLYLIKRMIRKHIIKRK